MPAMVASGPCGVAAAGGVVRTCDTATDRARRRVTAGELLEAAMALLSMTSTRGTAKGHAAVVRWFFAY